MKRFYKFVFVVLLLSIFILPNFVQAAPSWFPIVPCGLNQQPPGIDKSVHDYTQPCDQCQLIGLGKNLIDFILYGVVPMVGTLFFLWAGFTILWGGRNGDPNAVKKGTSLMWNTAIGIAIMLSAWLVANFILKTLATEDKATEWYKIECRVSDLRDLTDVTIPRVGTSPQPTTPGGPAPGPGGSCPQSNLNLCQGQKMTCSNSSCGKYVGAVNKYAGGAASANLLKAIMIKESSCNASAVSSHGAYGLMQILPSTANMYKSRCGVTAQIDGNWLKANPELSICIAAEYLRSLSQGECGGEVRNLAAGYNGGSTACKKSVSCASQTSCGGGAPRKWECLYDNPEHSQCNTGYNETRDYATKVMYCTNNPGF